MTPRPLQPAPRPLTDRGRVFNAVDLVNKLEAEAGAGRQGRMADYLPRMDFIVTTNLAFGEWPSVFGERMAS
jgi:hypothetical protein